MELVKFGFELIIISCNIDGIFVCLMCSCAVRKFNYLLMGPEVLEQAKKGITRGYDVNDFNYGCLVTTLPDLR